ncbi:hypothetical protein D9M68_292230 [compost metagenome]
MADVDHQYRTHLCLELGIFYYQIVFGQLKAVDTVIDLGIFKTFGQGNAFEAVAKVEFPEFSRMFVAASGIFGLMVARTASLKIAENLVKGLLAYGSFCFCRDGKSARTVVFNFFSYKSFLF